MTRLSVLIPAHNEAAYIGACLDAVLASGTDTPVQIIVAANACMDNTVDIARRYVEPARGRGFEMLVLDLSDAGKLAALNRAELAAEGDMIAYLDADVVIAPDLLAQLVHALDGDAPRYASGTPRVVARSFFSKVYARFWARLPFVAHGVPGFGIFAVNRAGRALWGSFPDIISDDTFVRLQFTPNQRIRVPARYDWPMIEGFGRLAKVRRRQDAGVAEIAAHHPHLLKNDDEARLGGRGLLRLGLRDPLGFAAYAMVKLAVKTPLAHGARWARGR